MNSLVGGPLLVASLETGPCRYLGTDRRSIVHVSYTNEHSLLSSTTRQTRFAFREQQENY